MFIIPMAGRSQRFFNAGYPIPKYQLPLGGSTVFRHAVESFSNYFSSDDFLFICRNDDNEVSFIDHELQQTGIKSYRLSTLTRESRGQADTVYQAIQDIEPKGGLFIFNIDTFRPGFIKPNFLSTCDGYLEVFEAEGDRWSFVLPDNFGNRVARTTEKHRVSSLCSNGLYYFASKSLFIDAFESTVTAKEMINGEYYISTLYNHLIGWRKVIKYTLVDIASIINCGTPSEYERLIQSQYNGFQLSLISRE